MDYEALSTLVTKAFNQSNKTFRLNLSKLENKSFDNIAADYFPNSVFQLNNAALTSAVDQLTVVGVSNDSYLKNTTVTAIFKLDGVNAVLSLTAKANKSWSFKNIHSGYEKTVAYSLVFNTANSPSFTLSSQDDNGMVFAGELDLKSMSGGFSTLLGIESLHMNGPLQFANGGETVKLIEIGSPPSDNVDIGFTTVDQFSFKVLAQFTYDFDKKYYDALPVLGFSTNINFSAQAKKHVIPLSVQFANVNSDIRFVAGISGLIDASVDEINALTKGLDIGTLIPPDLLTTIGKYISLKKFNFAISIESGVSLKTIGLQVGTTQPWPIATINNSSKKIAIELDNVDMNLSRNLQTKSNSMIVSGAFKITPKATLIFSLSYPGTSFQAYLQQESVLSLNEVADVFIGSTTAVPALNITGFSLNLSADQYQIDMVLGGAWVFLSSGSGDFKSDLFVIEEAEFFIEKSNQEIKSSVSGLFSLGECVVCLSADHPSNDDGWIYSASESGDINLTALINDFAKRINLELPSIFPDITIESLQLRFEEKSKKFNFSGKIKASGGAITSLDLQQINGDFSIESTVDAKTGKRNFSGSIKGQFLIGHVEFDVEYDFGKDSRVMSASFKENEGHSLNIEDIAHLLGLSAVSIPEEFDLGLISASFHYDLDNKSLFLNAKSKHYGTAFFATGTGDDNKSGYCFGLRLPDSLNPDNLPFVGNVLAEVPSFSVEEIVLLVSTLNIEKYTVPKEKDGKSLVISLSHGIQIAGRFTYGADKKSDHFTLLAYSTDQVSTPDALSLSNNTQQAKPAPIPVAKNQPIGIWMKVQKRIGPVDIAKVGLGYESGNIMLMPDLTLTTSGMSLTPLGLGIGVAINDPTNLSATISGLGLGYTAPPLQISGGFMKNSSPVAPIIEEYNGQATLSLEPMMISALGSYAKIKTPSGGEATSLMVFASIDYPLGGPPFAFVTGLAAGFGFNRKLKLPSLDNLPTFPLVEGAFPEKTPFGNSDPNAALEVMDKYIPASLGDYWLAVGVRFTSFELLNSFALLSASFGSHLEFAIMGISRLSVPAEEPNPIAFAEMALEAVYVPDEGILSVSAKLTSESYVVSHDCHLTGGFGLIVWFKGDHAGDFVVTLGGYSPYYKKPQQYPSEQLLGLNWRLSGQLSIKGGNYFALTPSVLMAGGRWEANFHSGPVHAWFNMSTDILIRWKPFHYNFHVSLDLGVSVHISLLFCSFDLSFSLGADANIWGPKFGGVAHIHLSVISFSIHFGDDSPKQKTLLWDEFKSSFLPKDKSGYCHSQVTKGLISDSKVNANSSVIRTLAVGDQVHEIRWFVSSQAVSFSLKTVLPSKSMSFNGEVVKGNWETNVGIASMALDAGDYDASTAVNLVRIDPSTGKANTYHEVTHSISTQNVPNAMWGKEKLAVNEPELIPNVLMGLDVHAPLTSPDITKPMSVAALQYDTEGVRIIKWPDTRFPSEDKFDQSSAMQVYQDTLLDPSVAKTRSSIISVLLEAGAHIDKNIDIHSVGNGNQGLLAAPVLSYLGEMKSV